MGKSRIEWTDASWNPLRVTEIDGKPNVSKSGHHGTGCTMISPGCKNCWASAMNRRFYGNRYSYHSQPTGFYLDEKILTEPVRRKKPTLYFVCSTCDLFHEQVPAGLQDDMLQIMLDNPLHWFLLLTKRPKSMRDSLNAFYANREVPLMDNVWCGVSAENQEMADLRIPTLLEVPSTHLFVSIEPMLGPVDLTGALPLTTFETAGFSEYDNEPRQFLDWVIVGGESGPGYRPMNIGWVQSLADQCQAANVPIFVKQDSGPRAGQRGRLPDELWKLKENPCTT